MMASLTNLALVMVALVMMLSYSQAHKYVSKKCPYPKAVENFNQTGILGRWRVDYAVRTTSTCLEFDFRQEGNTFKVYEYKELAVPEKVGVEMKYGSVGTLRSTAESGYYQVSYSTSAISGRFVVLATDYATYLVVLHCQQLGFLGSRRALYVLTRPGGEITEQRLADVKSRMPALGLEAGLLARVSHEQCVSRDEADVDLTGSVNLRDVVAAARKIVSVGGSLAQLVEVLSMLGKK